MLGVSELPDQILEVRRKVRERVELDHADTAVQCGRQDAPYPTSMISIWVCDYHSP
jgi:hypothetical protein